MIKKLPLEKVLVKQIKEYLASLNHQVFKYHGGMFGVTGFSDLHGHVLCCGRALYIEVKRLGQKPTPAQAAFIARMQATGAIAFWCDNLDECKDLIVHDCA